MADDTGGGGVRFVVIRSAAAERCVESVNSS